MRKPNILKRRLKAGDVVMGLWCVLPSASVTNVIASAGLDFVIIDLEHGPAGFETAEDMVRAAESEGCCPLIRLGMKNEENILKALDIGAHGILVAHVHSSQDAREIVSWAKYSPLGNRGFSPFTRAGGYGMRQVANHAQNENEETFTGLILEGKDGLDNLDAIVETAEVDLIYIGAYDLSQALGMPGQVQHPTIKKHLETCIRRIRDAGIAAGGYVAKNDEDLRWMLDIGMQFITWLPEVTVLHHACEQVMERFQAALRERDQKS
ncbi:MAG: aldolase/citrate lyase family protein [Syntrophobacterales bacterium]|jgi:4-hydroxy-2-oxoheptanedioate aldolase|nr:aldolase/citrate lyase family protein [Syntrophobacterales bacterium]